MAATYSLAATGQRADQQFAVSALKVSDAAGTNGLQQSGMAANSQVMCKGPDGAQRLYTIDASRSTPGNLVMLAVGP